MHSGVFAEDTIVLVDFVNKTGDATFDDSLNTALSLSLRQFPFFKVLSYSDDSVEGVCGCRETIEVLILSAVVAAKDDERSFAILRAR